MAKKSVSARKKKADKIYRVIRRDIREAKREPVSSAPAETRRMTRLQKAVEEARLVHEEWIIDFGHGGDIVSDMGYRAHVMKVLRLLGLDENLAIEATQIRKQCGLEPLDVLRLAFNGTLRDRVEHSRNEVAEKSIQNQLDAERKALKKKQRRY